MLLNEILEKPVASHRDGHFDRADATANWSWSRLRDTNLFTFLQPRIWTLLPTSPRCNATS